MFQLFKTAVKNPVTEPKMAMTKVAHQYSPEVEQIHNEFESASDKLLEEAEAMLKTIDLSGSEKASRLEKLGFKLNKEVTRVKQEVGKKKMSESHKELVIYYKEVYPNNKFITEEQVAEICKKYGLVCGLTEKYIGFVPEKNLLEMEAFGGLKNKDQVHYAVRNTCVKMVHVCNIHKNEWIGGHEYIVAGGRPKNDCGSRYKQMAADLGVAEGHMFLQKFSIEGEYHICAPLKDMKLSQDEFIDAKNRIQKHIPDPVVLKACRGGYLVLTKWGEEASDPILND